jgi:hypothetical protein
MDKAVSTPMIDRLVVEIRDHMLTWEQHNTEASRLEDEASKHDEAALDERAQAGVKLVQLRFQVEANGERWWRWFEANESRFQVQRREVERLLKIGRADDPQAALDDDRAKARDGMAKSRATNNDNISRDSDPSHSWQVEAVSMDGRIWRDGVRLATREEAEDYIEFHARHDVESFAIAAIIKSDDEPRQSITGKRRTLHFMDGECGFFHWAETAAPPASETVETVKALAKSWADLAAKVETCGQVSEPIEEVIEAAPEEFPEMPLDLDRRKRGRPPGSKNKCKKCGGTGRIVGKTGTPFDCECVKGAA